MVLTAASEIFRSTAFNASFAETTGDFCARNEVEKEALGVKRRIRSAVVDGRVRNDMAVIVRGVRNNDCISSSRADLFRSSVYGLDCCGVILTWRRWKRVNDHPNL